MEVGGLALPAKVRAEIADPQNLLEPATRALIPPEYLPKLTALLGDAVWYAFLTMFVLMIIGCAVSLRLAPYTPASTPRSDETPTR